MKKITELTAELAAPAIAEQGCTLWDVEYVKEAGTWYLRILLDKEGGVDILDCEEISRKVSDLLDEADPIEGSYTLEVGSAGAERGQVYDEFNSKQHEILTGVVTRVDPRNGNLSLRIGTGTDSTEALLMAGEQVPGEDLTEGMHVKVYVVEVRRSTRGPQVLISRTHPGLVKRLFELEVPEIYDGTVEVKSIAREAGSRTKMAVWSNDENVDPIGACVGPKGQRVGSIVEELRGEKIDIVKYSEDPAQFIAAALAPADVVDVWMADEGKACRVIVPDDQLSLAIGKEGQNARLAARLTGYKIDIKPESYHDEEEPPAGGAPEAADTAEASAVEPVDAE